MRLPSTLCAALNSHNKISIIWSNRVTSAIKQKASIGCVKISVVRLSRKVVGMDLDPFSK